MRLTPNELPASSGDVPGPSYTDWRNHPYIGESGPLAERADCFRFCVELFRLNQLHLL